MSLWPRRVVCHSSLKLSQWWEVFSTLPKLTGGLGLNTWSEYENWSNQGKGNWRISSCRQARQPTFKRSQMKELESMFFVVYCPSFKVLEAKSVGLYSYLPEYLLSNFSTLLHNVTSFSLLKTVIRIN